MSEVKTYYSAIDSWLAIVVFLSTVGVAVWGFFALYQGKPEAWTLIGTGLGSLLLVVIIGVPCKYVVTDNEILIQSGVMKDSIKLSEIKSVKLSSNPISSPAWSLKRVEIQASNGMKLISPKDRDEFIKYVNSKIN